MSTSKPMHGTAKAAGCDHQAIGNFCKLIPDLSTWAEDCEITDTCAAEQVAAAIGGPGGLMDDAGDASPDSEIPAGYTFFAQFIDHDITLDVRSNLHGEVFSNEAITKLPNLRSASLDLDCVYGLGPEAMPFMYDQKQPGRLLVGSEVNGIKNPQDVPRNIDGRAMIGDPRNDENIFVSQLQTLFLRFHNKLMIGSTFEEAQKEVRYHYQFIVLYDFLKRVCDRDVYDAALAQIKANVEIDDPCERNYPYFGSLNEHGKICMPVEFSVAAYRFGHTLVRSSYPANIDNPIIELFDERFGTLGFGQVPPELNVDWRLLLDSEKCIPFAKCKRIDHRLASELINMPDPVVGRNAPPNDRSLAFRNILRSYVLGLPSGQKMAAALADAGYSINPAQDLKLTEIHGWDCAVKDLPCNVAEHTPLFFYLMREADIIGEGERLGPVGSAILMEVFGTMFVHCKTFLKDKDWKPNRCIKEDWKLTLYDIARYVNQ